MSKKTDDIKEVLLQESTSITDDDLLSSGSTLLNLACTGSRHGAFPKGYYVLFVGDSDSGKTWFCLNALAEAAIKESFKDYRLIYDGVEFGAIMDMERFFGKSLIEKLESPRLDVENNPMPSTTIQEVFYNVHNALDRGPCVYALDSMDAVTSDAAIDKFEEHRKAFEKGKTAAGSFGMDKAKVNSESLRVLMGRLQKTKSIFITVSQTRDNAGGGLFAPKKTFSGGYAQTFYSTMRIWSKCMGKLKQKVKEKELQVGIKSLIDVQRSRMTGKQRKIIVPIYNTYGIDDIESCIDFLVDWKIWNKTRNGFITFTGLGPETSKRKIELINYIESNDLEDDLRQLVADTWEYIEKECSMDHRKSRY